MKENEYRERVKIEAILGQNFFGKKPDTKLESQLLTTILIGERKKQVRGRICLYSNRHRCKLMLLL